MNISEIIQLKFPTANLVNNVVIQDDGQGPYIKKWDESLGPKPTKAQLESWIIELEPVAKLEEIKKEILPELEAIDRQSIRALREGNQERLAELEQQAELLRQKLRQV